MHHLLVVVDVDVRDVTHHEDGLLHLACVLDEVVHRLQRIVVLLALLVNLHGLLEVVDHVLSRRRCVDDVVGRVDDTLRNVGRIYDRPLCACPSHHQQEQADCHDYFCSHFTFGLSG